MKKVFTLLLAALLLLSLTACAQSKDLKEEGIAPITLSEEDTRAYYSDMSDTARFLSFQAPKEAISMFVHVYRLDASGAWEEYCGGGISIGEERKPVDTLSGVFAMELTENYSIDFRVNCAGMYAFQSDEIGLDKEIISSRTEFLSEFQEIELNKEIPVAMLVYSSEDLDANSQYLNQYNDTSRLVGVDLAQLVTLEFSDREME